MPPTDDALLSLLSRSCAYAGIGSRLTPSPALALMEAIGAMLGEQGLTLRSGGAKGADTAFEWGCDQVKGKKEIYLPWRRFNAHPSPLFSPPKEAQKLASLCHPNWAACDAVARCFHARNCQQILGAALGDPVDFVVFWATESGGVPRGGTATAVSLARQLPIPTFNLYDPAVFQQWSRMAGRYLSLSRPITGHPLSLASRLGLVSQKNPTTPPLC